MTTLYRVRSGGFWGTTSVLQRLDETDGAEWRDVPYTKTIGIFSAVSLRYWRQIESKLEEVQRDTELRKKAASTRKAQRDFKASQFTDTRMPQ